LHHNLPPQKKVAALRAAASQKKFSPSRKAIEQESAPAKWSSSPREYRDHEPGLSDRPEVPGAQRATGYPHRFQNRRLSQLRVQVPQELARELVQPLVSQLRRVLASLGEPTPAGCSLYKPSVE